MSKAHIVIATGIYPPSLGGPATYTKYLEEALPGKGFTVSVVSYDRTPHLPRGLRHVWYFTQLFFKSLSVDVIYALDPVSVGFPAMLVSKILWKPYLLRVAGDYAWEQGTQKSNVTDLLDTFASKKNGYGFFVSLLKKIQTLVARNATLVIVPSNYLKTIVSKWGVNSSYIQVIYNAFEAPEVSEGKEDLRRQFSLSGSVIVSVGRLVPWKGFKELLDVFKQVKEKISDAQLVIVGSGPMEKELQDIAHKEFTHGEVIFAGALPREETLKYLKAGDCFALYTSYEGLSHVLLEAMALSIPVVSTSVGGNIETIENNKEGILVPFGDTKAFEDAITLVLSNKETAALFVNNAKKKVALFTRERMIGELVEVLHSYGKQNGQ